MLLVASALAADTIYSNTSGCSLVAEGTELYVRGCNLHIENGAGSTYTNNGLGNVVLGYGAADSTDARTGSHNLVVGDYHSHSASGNVVAGYDNSITGYAASVTGGRQNTATANYTAVLGGRQNNAGKVYATVAGGRSNVASGQYAQIAGGYANRASGTYSAIAGGNTITLSESAGVALGALTASELVLTVSDFDTLSEYLFEQDGDVVVDGANLIVRNGEGLTTGTENGKGNLIVGYNAGEGTEARSGSHNVIIGDLHQWTASSGLVAGAGNLIDANYAVALGYLNQATAVGAAAIAGLGATASGAYAAVVGGLANEASGQGAVVLGGYDNTSSGPQSATIGGTSGSASGDYASVLGGSSSVASAWGSIAGGSSVTADDAGENAMVDRLGKRVDDIETTLTSWEPTIWEAVDVFTWLSVDADDDLVVEGANLKIVNGEGNTYDENGEGNLIVGYNTNAGSHTRTGSHNLVIGDNNEYTSYSGIVFGTSNVSSASNSLVGGYANEVAAPHSAIVSGTDNYTRGWYSAIVAGYDNLTDSESSAVVAGARNGTSGYFSAVLGGYANSAHGNYSTVTAGDSNLASGDSSTVYGGSALEASGAYEYQPLQFSGT